MKLITYGHLIKKSEFIEANHQRRTSYLNKPSGGLWASPLDSDYGWKDWCESEDFEIEDLNIYSVFSLKDNARILKINSFRDFKEILKKYGIKYFSVFDPERKTRYINWDELKKNWDAVFLTSQGNFECHHSMDESMESLNAWDCESIVILKWDIIDENSIEYNKKNRRNLILLLFFCFS